MPADRRDSPSRTARDDRSSATGSRRSPGPLRATGNPIESGAPSSARRHDHRLPDSRRCEPTPDRRRIPGKPKGDGCVPGTRDLTWGQAARRPNGQQPNGAPPHVVGATGKQEREYLELLPRDVAMAKVVARPGDSPRAANEKGVE